MSDFIALVTLGFILISPCVFLGWTIYIVIDWYIKKGND